jgi:GGDEF domain-containing protein
MQAIGQRIVDRVARPFDFEGRPCRIGASLGLSFSGLFDDPDPDALLEDADKALYGAKRQGRGQIVMSGRFARQGVDQSG